MKLGELSLASRENEVRLRPAAVSADSGSLVEWLQAFAVFLNRAVAPLLTAVARSGAAEVPKPGPVDADGSTTEVVGKKLFFALDRKEAREGGCGGNLQGFPPDSHTTASGVSQ